jgi:hypothetical protein
MKKSPRMAEPDHLFWSGSDMEYQEKLASAERNAEAGIAQSRKEKIRKKLAKKEKRRTWCEALSLQLDRAQKIIEDTKHTFQLGRKLRDAKDSIDVSFRMASDEGPGIPPPLAQRTKGILRQIDEMLQELNE